MAKSMWEPPRLRTVGEEEEERRATWLELFYDLVFVAAISEVAHYLNGHLSWWGFLGYVLLFVPIWWAWVGATFYATRFDTDDLGHRLLTLFQMVAIAVLAVNVHHGLDTTSSGFALSYVAVKAVLTLQYFGAWYFIPIARPLTSWYMRGYSLVAIIWLISIFVPVPWRFAVWIFALIIDLSIPVAAGKLLTKVPPNFNHVAERIGLFTIIVLGEAIIGVVKGVSQVQWGILSGVIALLGIIIAFSLWWMYFDSADGSPLEEMRVGNRKSTFIWLYSHLSLAIGIAATGVGVEHIIVSSKTKLILPDVDRWLIGGSVAMCLFSLAIIHLISCSLHISTHRKSLATYRLFSAAFIIVIAIAGVSLSPLIVVILVALACAVQVLLDLFLTREFKPQSSNNMSD